MAPAADVALWVTRDAVEEAQNLFSTQLLVTMGVEVDPGLRFGPRILLFLWPIVLSCGHGLQFYIRAGVEQRRCFYDSAPPGTKILGEYTVAAGQGAMPIDIDVRNAENTARLFYRQNIGHGKFAFVLPADEKSQLRVEHAEILRKQVLEQKQKSASARRLLEVADSVEKVPANDFIDGNDWDADKYQGLDDARMNVEMHAVEDELKRAHDPGHPKHRGLIGHDPFDDELMEDHDVADVFAERRFMICLTARGDPETQQRRVRLIVRKGNSAQDLHRLAKTEHMSNLEVSLRNISNELLDLLRQLERAHQMEEGLRAINQNTNKFVVAYAGLSLFVMVIFGMLQARYVKVYFKQKKLA